MQPTKYPGRQLPSKEERHTKIAQKLPVSTDEHSAIIQRRPQARLDGEGGPPTTPTAETMQYGDHVKVKWSELVVRVGGRLGLEVGRGQGNVEGGGYLISRPTPMGQPDGKGSRG